MTPTMLLGALSQVHGGSSSEMSHNKSITSHNCFCAPLRSMVADHQKRATNHEELLRSLKEVNQIIQQASRLRVGSYKTQVGDLMRYEFISGTSGG